MPRSFNSDNTRAETGSVRTALTAKKRRLKIPVAHLFDLPVNCRFRFNKLMLRSSGHHAHVSLMRLFNSARWPSRVTRWNIDSINHIAPIHLPSRRFIGQFFSKKLGRPVMYESYSKRQFLRRLERAHAVLWYVEHPVSLPYCAAGKAFVHVPDVLVWLRDERVLMCEVRNPGGMAKELLTPRWNALTEYCQAAGWGLLLTDGEFSERELNRHSLDAAHEAELVSMLDAPRSSSCAELRRRLKLSKKDLATFSFRYQQHLCNPEQFE